MGELKWVDAGTVREGLVVATINRSELDNGNVFHSIRFGRAAPGGKPTQFLRVEDLDTVSKLSKAVKEWIALDVKKIRDTLTATDK